MPKIHLKASDGRYSGPTITNDTFGKVLLWAADFDGDSRAEILGYYPDDGSWRLRVSDGNKLYLKEVGNTSGFGRMDDDRPFWVADFTGDGRADILFYYPGDGNWWLGSYDGHQLNWRFAANTLGFGQVWDGRPFWVGDFNGDGIAEMLFYYPDDGNWWLGSYKGANPGLWSFAGNTNGFGGLNDGRPIWASNFVTLDRTDILFYFPDDGNWWSAVYDGKQFVWSYAGNTAGFGQVWDGRPFWVGDFNGDGLSEVLFYTPGDANWWLGSIAQPSLWSFAGNTSGFGDLSEGRRFWVGNFSRRDRTQILFYYPGDGNWWMGTHDGKQFAWDLMGNTASFGNLADGRPFWDDDFIGYGFTNLLFYHQSDDNWWVESFKNNHLELRRMHPFGDGSLVKGQSDSTVFVIYNDVKYKVISEDALLAMGRSGDDVQVVPDSTLAGFALPQPPILETDFVNPRPSFPTNISGWTSSVVGGQWPVDNRWSWTPVLDNNDQFDRKLVGASGTVITPELAASDNPITHPFGKDWECWMALDPGRGYEELLSSSNHGRLGEAATEDYLKASEHAMDKRLPVPENPGHAGVLGVEWEQSCFPEMYRPDDGERMAVFGRWIVDAGHTDFHTEIHPPLLLARGKQVSNEATYSTVVGRPYLVGQEFDDGPFLKHLLIEVHKVALFASQKVEARPPIAAKPFAGTQTIRYFVRPPSPQPPPEDTNATVKVRFSFTARKGVTVNLSKADEHTVLVTITMTEELYEPRGQIAGRTENYFPSQLGLSPDDLDKVNYLIYAGIADGALFGEILFPPLGGAINAWRVREILNGGILTDSYQQPVMPAPLATRTCSIDALNTVPHFELNNNQPFPVYGYLTVAWGKAPSLRMVVEVIRLDGDRYMIQAHDTGSKKSPPNARVFIDNADMGPLGTILSPYPKVTKKRVFDRERRKWTTVVTPEAFVVAPNYASTRIPF
jgi:hypothetical protein